MPMNYKGYLSFAVIDKSQPDQKISHEKYDVPVSEFAVIGGTSNNIKLNSTEDLSIMSALKQAQILNNIDFFLSKIQRNSFLVFMDLSSIANNGLRFLMNLSILRFSGGTMLEGLILSGESELEVPPRYFPDMYEVFITLHKTSIFQGKMGNKHYMSKVTKEL